MSKFVPPTLLAGLLVAMTLTTGCGQRGEPTAPVQAEKAFTPSAVPGAEPQKPANESAMSAPSVDLAKARKDVEARFKGSKDEPTSKDAVWTSDSIFKVGVLDDGTDRSGYAQYVCEVLYEHGFKGEKVWVQVIDIAKLVRTNKWEKLGEAHCE